MEVVNAEVDADILIEIKKIVDGVQCDLMSHFARSPLSLIGADHSDIRARHRITGIVLVDVAPDRVLSLNQSVESNRLIGETEYILEFGQVSRIVVQDHSVAVLVQRDLGPIRIGFNVEVVTGRGGDAVNVTEIGAVYVFIAVKFQIDRGFSARTRSRTKQIERVGI